MTENSNIRTRQSIRLQSKSINVKEISALKQTPLKPPRISTKPKPKPKPVELKPEEPEDLLIGREVELENIDKYINDYLQNKNGSIYVSGAPGTGKTASVYQILRGIEKRVKIKHFLLNCMKLDNPHSILKEIAVNLGAKNSLTGSMDDQFEQLEVIFSRQTLPLVIILDEIDQLASKHHQVLYRIFDWPKNLPQKIIVVGIANSLDLTERLLPKLFTTSFRPHHIAFAPYNPQEISKILSERLKVYHSNVAFDNFAIQMCARNVSASSGDLRKAFTICHRALDIARKENKENKSDLDMITVSIRHIKAAIRESETAGDIVQQTISADTSDLPLHHKLILAALMLLKNRRQSTEFPVGLLHEAYQSVCSGQKINPVSMSDFSSICDLMDSRGLVRLTVPGPKSQALSTPSRLKKIALKLDVKGVASLLNDQSLLSAIMEMKI